jgi:hypothetical protein
MRYIFLIIFLSSVNVMAKASKSQFYDGEPVVFCKGGPFSSFAKPHGGNIDLTLSRQTADFSIGQPIYRSLEMSNYTISVYMESYSSGSNDRWWEKVIAISYKNDSTGFSAATRNNGSVSLEVNGEVVSCN